MHERHRRRRTSPGVEARTCVPRSPRPGGGLGTQPAHSAPGGASELSCFFCSLAGLRERWRGAPLDAGDACGTGSRVQPRPGGVPPAPPRSCFTLSEVGIFVQAGRHFFFFFPKMIRGNEP